MVSTVIAVLLFAFAAYAAMAAIMCLARQKVIHGTRSISNIRLYGTAAAAIALALLLEGLGILEETPVIGLGGSLIMLVGLAGVFKSRGLL